MAVKKVTEAAEALETKDEVKKETPAKKTAARKPAAKKAETAAVKAEEVKEAAVKEEAPVKKPAAKKPAAKKTAEPKVTVTLQFQGKSIAAEDILEAVKNAFAQANPDVAVKTIDLYVKPEENTAYYAVNGEGSEDYKVEL